MARMWSNFSRGIILNSSSSLHHNIARLNSTAVDELPEKKVETERPPLPVAERQRKPLPQGYRQGFITAITVLLGFSLGFFRFWGFESPGHWTLQSFIPATTLAIAVVLQIIALFRALNVADDDEHEYKKTVKWFIASAVVLLVGMILALLEFYDVFWS
jgi:hypothetical protein